MKFFKQFFLWSVLIFTLYVTFLSIQTLEDSEHTREKENRIINHLENNSESSAWLTVEGTNIDYPILRHPTDDSYYLTHDINHQETYYGSIFIEKINALDFNDLVTIVYGHAIQDGSMFGNLHYFANESFFQKHKTISIVTSRDHFHYEIIAAYPYNDNHLYDTFQLSDSEQVQTYVEGIETQAKEMNGFYRHYSFDEHRDKLLILSTCDTEDNNQRFVVHAIRKGEL